MGAERKVAIITGASQGIGEALVKGYRDRNFRVVPSSRSIKPSSTPIMHDLARRLDVQRPSRTLLV